MYHLKIFHLLKTTEDVNQTKDDRGYIKKYIKNFQVFIKICTLISLKTVYKMLIRLGIFASLIIYSQQIYYEWPIPEKNQSVKGAGEGGGEV